ncbi:TetR/AcrR family transcriptional regulator [Minwuia thermotolerans]|uniref:TetR/AcrR family transcriptional regulator n=1 Tax=Minwuia thermotolerans TaxID=2056226 RepID=A0A2M9G7F3_9PROT|nr:TetR/AcrR family transcriptional regulator [Minwuia thermotolerans]PJK31649.1 TetR/AcrR family transcriptional regulator [Minwuia thermotolerans]
MRKGFETRERIMDVAEQAVLEKGFGATSIDEIIAAAEITKSGFIYHFPDKPALARALLERYIERDDQVLDDIFGRAFELTDDPLQAMLVGLKLFAELMADLPAGHPGCLVATYCYQERLFDSEIREINARAVQAWRRRFRSLLDDIVATYPPRDEVDLDDLADMFSTVIEGGIVMSKALRDPPLLARQVLLLRSYVKLLLSPRVGR